jgi:hypothetical protein
VAPSFLKAKCATESRAIIPVAEAGFVSHEVSISEFGEQMFLELQQSMA